MTSISNSTDSGVRRAGFSTTQLPAARAGAIFQLAISSGKFRNDEFGNYKLAVHNSVDACIVVHRTNGEVTVFNMQDDGSTREFYDRLSMAVSEAKGSVSTCHCSVAIA